MMGHFRSMLWYLGVFGLVLTNPDFNWAEARGGPVVRIAYFVPGDREPIPGYVDRLDSVMTEVQRFFREGMADAGYGNKTFQLDRDQAGRLQVYTVRGRHPSPHYGRNASGAVRHEVKTALAKKGFDIDRETLVIFQVLLQWEGDKAIEVGPYCGGGSHLGGTAWVYDDRLLDTKLLGSRKSGGYYHRPCSIGEFNSHYIGGVAHELGHGFGLPHACQRAADRVRGTALMGAGNHTYGQELRGEGRGTFLTDTSAMMLAYTRPFAGDVPQARLRPRCKITSLDTAFEQGRLVLAGQLSAAPAADGIAAYNDPGNRSGDYDAVGWTCKVDKQGRFKLEIRELRPGPFQLRLRVCHVNGTKSGFAFDYRVDRDGKPETGVFSYSLLLDRAIDAYRARDKRRLEAAIDELQRRCADMAIAQQKAAHLRRLMQRRTLRSADEIPADEKTIAVSDLRFRSQVVGWGRVHRDEVLMEGSGHCFLQVGDKFFASGLYAHASSRYEIELRRKWRSFRTSYGLQDGHAGSVVFVVRGDGKELFRSGVIRDHQPREANLDVSKVDVIELSVEDGGDGKSSDWGVWLSPTLQR